MGPGRPRARAGIVALALALALAGCGAAAGGEQSAQGAGEERPTVVATHSILGDLVTRVVGDAATVVTIMPPGADAHEFDASAQQIELMNGADLLVANGLGFEEQLLEPIEAAEADGVAVLELGEELDPIPFAEGEEHAEEEGSEHAEGEEHGHEGDDPHWFQDPDRAAAAVRLVGERVAEVTGDDAATERAETFAAELEALAAEVEDTLAVVPDDRRKLVTNHDAFGYFADRFDFEVVGVIVPGGSDLAEPSARGLDELAATIEAEGAPAIFAENVATADLADTLAGEVGEVGDVEVVELFSDSLGEPGSEAATYPDLVRANAERIAGALGA